MALITCPECQKRISQKAETCPGCAFKMTPEVLAECLQKQEEIKLQQQAEHQSEMLIRNSIMNVLWFWVIVAVVFVSLFVYAVVRTIPEDQRQPEPPKTEEQLHQERINREIMEKIKDMSYPKKRR